MGQLRKRIEEFIERHEDRISEISDPGDSLFMTGFDQGVLNTLENLDLILEETKK